MNAEALARFFPYKTTKDLFVLPSTVTVAFARKERMKKLCYTLEQGSRFIKHPGDNEHRNVLNPETLSDPTVKRQDDTNL